MRELKNRLTDGKSSTNIQSRRTKSFGYQVLGFGAGGVEGPRCITYDFFVAGAGAGGGRVAGGGGGGGGGVYTSYCNAPISGITKNTDCGAISIQIGVGGVTGASGATPGSAGGTSIAFKCEPTAVTIKGGGGGSNNHVNGVAAPTPGGGSGGGGGCYHHCNSTLGGAGSCYGQPGGAVPTRSESYPAGRARAGGGGGVCVAGSIGGVSGPGAGGNGKVSSIEGTCKNYGCGGTGGCSHNNGVPGVGGRGDGGLTPGRAAVCGQVATANQAGGAGGQPAPTCITTGADGVTYLRFPTACKPGALAVTPGCNSILTTGSDTVLKFIVSGCVTFT